MVSSVLLIVGVGYTRNVYYYDLHVDVCGGRVMAYRVADYNSRCTMILHDNCLYQRID